MLPASHCFLFSILCQGSYGYVRDHHSAFHQPQLLKPDLEFWGTVAEKPHGRSAKRSHFLLEILPIPNSKQHAHQCWGWQRDSLSVLCCSLSLWLHPLLQVFVLQDNIISTIIQSNPWCCIHVRWHSSIEHKILKVSKPMEQCVCQAATAGKSPTYRILNFPACSRHGTICALPSKTPTRGSPLSATATLFPMILTNTSLELMPLSPWRGYP